MGSSGSKPTDHGSGNDATIRIFLGLSLRRTLLELEAQLVQALAAHIPAAPAAGATPAAGDTPEAATDTAESAPTPEHCLRTCIHCNEASYWREHCCLNPACAATWLNDKLQESWRLLLQGATMTPLRSSHVFVQTYVTCRRVSTDLLPSKQLLGIGQELQTHRLVRKPNIADRKIEVSCLYIFKRVNGRHSLIITKARKEQPIGGGQIAANTPGEIGQPMHHGVSWIKLKRCPLLSWLWYL